MCADITLRYKPHAAQLKLHQSKAQYRTALCGRRWGKSLAAVYEIIKRIKDPNIRMAWLAPSYSTCEIGVDALRHICKDAEVNGKPFVNITGNSPRKARFCNGVIVPFISLQRAEFVRGSGFDFLIIDEGELIKDKIFYDVIAPTLAQSQYPEILAISTPKRKNSWFNKSFNRGLDKINNPTFESFHFPSSANPFLNSEYLEEQKSILPFETYQREYLAQYPESDSDVFKTFMKCVHNDYDKSCPHEHRSIGFDMAKMNDYCVLTAICLDCGRVIDFDRFNHEDWMTVVNRLHEFQIRNIMDATNPTPIFFDSTGIGGVVSDLIKDRGIANSIAYIFTNPSKQKLVTDLTALFDHERISLSPDLVDLIDELQVFEVIISPSGNNIYNAPEGFHDDAVYSLALACQGFVKGVEIVKPWVYDSDNDVKEIPSDKFREQNKDDTFMNFINQDFDDQGHF